MVYMDTSVLVALLVPETGSTAVAAWYAGTKAELVCAAWCVPEFASAMSIKQRTGQLKLQGLPHLCQTEVHRG